MLLKGVNNKYFIILFVLIIVSYAESKRSRSGSGGGRRTTSRSHQHHTTRRYENKPHSTESHLGFDRVTPAPTHSQPSIGFENVQQRLPPQNNQPHVSETHHQTNARPVGNSPNSPIGFENVQNRNPPQNNPPYPTNTHPAGGNSGHGIGFDNVHRTPPQNNQPYPQQGYQQHGYQQHGYPQQHYPAGYPNNNYNQNSGQFGSPNFYQPSQGSYYNPHFGSPGAQPPHIYQPVKQSSGIGVGTALGFAGALGGGYLIGRLTSGGGHNSDDHGHTYTVHHYHHNANGIPKEMKVTENALINCTQNATQGLCVPNSFPICLVNGTIMCVTHTAYTTPCGTNTTMACVVTILPCTGNDSSCNNTGNFSTTAVYIPCISNITVSKQKIENSTNGGSSNNALSATKAELCVTAVAEPKTQISPVGSYLNFITQLAVAPIMNQTFPANATNITNNTNINSNHMVYDSVTTHLPVST